jgi:Icc protein
MRKFNKALASLVILFVMSFLVGCQTVSSEPKPVIVAAHLTDIHLRKQRDSVNRFQTFITQLRKDHPDITVIVNTGDILDGYKGVWKFWTDSVQAGLSDLDVYNLLGNHDPEADIKDIKALCKLLNMPNRYYNFDHKNWRFFMLDGNTVWKEKAQQQWLAKELKATPASTPVVILSHQPLQANKAVTSILSSYPNVKLCLTGHTHNYKRIKLDGITYIEGGAVSGYWWEQEPGNNSSEYYKKLPSGFGLVKLYKDGTFSYDYITHNH